METAVKIFIIVIILCISAKAIHWTWTSQIDPVATIKKFVSKQPKIADVVVTRDPNKLYQDGKIVADVTGHVEINNETIILKQIANISALNRENPIEYKRMKLQIIQVGRIIGMKTVISNGESSVLQNVMEDVICEEIN
ncbi:hypothetical protein ACFL1N_12385 [Thermodesulfobacteriota bacterium]